LENLAAREAVEALAAALKGGPAGPGRVSAGSARLVEPCEALLEAWGELGVAEFGGAGGDHASSTDERPVVSNAAAEPCFSSQVKPLLV